MFGGQLGGSIPMIHGKKKRILINGMLAGLLILSALVIIPSTNAAVTIQSGYNPDATLKAAVRYKDFSNGGDRAVYLGVPDLGVGSNRVETEYTWSTGHYLAFDYRMRDMTDNLYTTVDGNDPLLTYPVGPLTSLDYIQILVSSTTDSAYPGSVSFDGVSLTHNAGFEFLGSFTSSNEGGKTWMITGVDVTSGFSIEGTLVLSGTQKQGEHCKVEISVGSLPTCQPVVYVDDDALSGWYDYGHVATMQEAIDHVCDGGTIYVLEGSYFPVSTINVDKSVSIFGPQAGVDPRPFAGTTRIPGDAAEAVIDGNGINRIFYIDADNVVIDGLEVCDGYDDLIRQSNTHTGTIVKNCIIHDALDDEGIQLANCNDGSIEYNYIFDVAQDGANLAESTSSRIYRNEITTSASENGAVFVYDSIDITIEGNYIHHTSANNGIKLYTNIGDISIINNLISENEWEIKSKHHEYSGNAILGYKYTETGSIVTIQHNTISDNMVAATSPYHFNEVGFGNGIGIATVVSYSGLYYDGFLDIQNNIISQNGLSSYGWGIISKEYYGCPGPSPFNCLIDYNDFYNNGAGVCSGTFCPVGINNMYVDPQFNGGGDYNISLTSPCKDAGTILGVTVDIVGTLRDPTPDIGAYEAVMTCIPVCRNVEDNIEYCTIQDAIDAGTTSDGETIEIYTGTHIEQVNVYKELTLFGQGIGTTIIQSPDILTDFFATSNNNYPIVYIHDVDNVEIRDLTVDGAGKGNANYRFVGIGIFQAGATIQDLNVINVRDTPFSGAQHGVAIYGWSDATGISHTITIDTCDIINYQKTGIALGGSDLTTIVNDCTVTGFGPTSTTAQNGIQPTWAASGVLVLYTGGPIDIIDNIIHENQANIYILSCPATIEDNDIYATQAGTGVTSFYGILGDPGDPPMIPDASPVEEPVHTRDKATYVITCTGNTVESDMPTGLNTGIGVYAGMGGSYDIDFTATENTVRNWEWGFELYAYSPNLLSAEMHCNIIEGNTYGAYNYLTTAFDATCNWWGDCSGPTHSSNPTGMGDEVTDFVTFDPWIGSIHADAGGPYVAEYDDDYYVNFYSLGTSTPGCCDETVSYLWDFGDGETSTEANPLHQYHRTIETSYTVTLTVTTTTLGQTCQAVDTTTVTVDAEPDDSAPIIQLIYPKGGEILSGTVIIEWYAIDEDYPAGSYLLPIYLYYRPIGSLNWQLIDGPLINDGEYSWDTSRIADGEYEMLAEAVDTCNNAMAVDRSDPFTISGSGAGLKLDVGIQDTSIDSSIYVKDGDTIQVTAAITGALASQITREDITADLTGFNQGTMVAENYDGFLATWTLTNVECNPTNGPITITVYVSDQATETETITADNTHPEATLEKPLNGLYFYNNRLLPLQNTVIFGPIDIQVTGTDNTGINKVEYRIDNELLHTDIESEYEWYMNQRLTGRHQLQVTIYDHAGNTIELTEIINVYNFFGE